MRSFSAVFTGISTRGEELEKVIHLVTGKRLSKDELRKMASRIADMTRTFNIREGLKPGTRRLPRRRIRSVFHQGSSD